MGPNTDYLYSEMYPDTSLQHITFAYKEIRHSKKPPRAQLRPPFQKFAKLNTMNTTKLGKEIHVKYIFKYRSEKLEK